MSIRNKLAAFLLFAGAAWPQAGPLDPRSSMHITLPDDSPVTLLSADWGESRADNRGGAMVLDLHTSLMFRNSGQRRIRGITLLVAAQEVTPGGKASVSVPSLDAGPGDAFPVRIDLRLLRPVYSGSGPLVQVVLDGVLFDDLGFYGPDKLNCRRSMTVWELEARRDRKYFKSILEAEGPQGLQKEILASLARQADRPRVDMQMARAGRATNYEPERELNFAFLQMPEAPVEPVAGSARVAGTELRAPRLEVVNRSKSPVRYLEIGWILKDRSGKEFVSGSLPSELSLAPGQRAQISQQTTLKLARPAAGGPLEIDSVTGFVNHVEFSDGRIWIPSRSALRDAHLQYVLAPSPEEQRLTDLYRRKGLPAVVEQLKKF
jgi:hypothetical protein